MVKPLLLLINGHPQPKRARNDDIALVEIGKELDTFARKLDAYSEAIIDIALEHLDMIWRIGPRWCVGKLVFGMRGKSILAQESRMVFNLIVRSWYMFKKSPYPTKSPISEGKQDEDRWPSETLISNVVSVRLAWRFSSARQTLIILQYLSSLSTIQVRGVKG